MREIGRAEKSKDQRAEAAARLRRRAEAEGFLDKPSRKKPEAVVEPKEIPVAAETLSMKEIRSDLPGLFGSAGLPMKLSRGPRESAPVAAEPRAEAEAAADLPSDRHGLIRRVLQNPRRTREEVRDCLALVVDLHLEVALEEVKLVQAARDARLSWTEIAAAQNLKARQSAEQRYKRLLASVSPLLEREGWTPGVE